MSVPKMEITNKRNKQIFSSFFENESVFFEESFFFLKKKNPFLFY